ncbi:MAG TPA: hypothetical protein VNT32_01695 [Thermoleophilaceae bacterium]|nr:hypothetical protein [Thermoleophilaceae bacterium]
MKEIRSKKKCCKDRPRCKRCPVVIKRLENAGVATRVDRRTWRLDQKPSKKALRAARA